MYLFQSLEKTKFDHKFDRIRQAVLDQYEERLAEIKAECGDTDLSDCLAYQDCSGVGDRMNTVRGKPDVAMSEAFLAFVDVRNTIQFLIIMDLFLNFTSPNSEIEKIVIKVNF